MSLAPCLTNIDNSSGPLFALSGQGGGGGGGGGGSTITVSTILGNPEFVGNAIYISQQNALNDGVTIVANPPNSFGAPLVSTAGLKLDMGGQVAYILENPTAGLGTGNGLNIFANGITLGSSQGVAINGGSGGGAGSLTVSSLNVSSINGATPGGGGGGGGAFAVPVSTTATWVGTDGLIPIGKMSTIPGHMYSAFLQIDSVSSFATPAADDRIALVDPVASVPYCKATNLWASTLVHNPRGDSVMFSWKADLTSTSVFHWNTNGNCPSTTATVGNGGIMLVTDLGLVS